MRGDASNFGKQQLCNTALYNSIAASLLKNKAVVLLYFDIVSFHEVEQLSDSTVANRVLSLFKEALQVEIPRLVRQGRLLGVENLWGDDFVVLLSMDRKPHILVLQDIAVAYRVAIRDKLKKDAVRMTGKPLELHIGYSMIENRGCNLDIRLYRAVREAQEIAKGKMDLQTARLLFEFKEMLHKELFHAVYQPIVSLRTDSVLGWEALARGPAESYFQNPGVAFSFAEEMGLLFPLENLCRKKALQGVGKLDEGQKLFLNIHPNTINDPHFAGGQTLKIIQGTGIAPHNVVFELTERHNIHDFTTMNRTLEHYRCQGFLVAVDDAGAGFSSLQSIAELRPDFIKMDMSLVRGVNVNSAKRALLETMVAFAEKFNSFIIAEGIEQDEELYTLVNIGVHFGQGFYLGRPVAPPSPPNEEAFDRLIRITASRRNSVLKHAFPIMEIAEATSSVRKDIHVWEVKETLDGNEDLQGVVVVDEGKPVGLVMRNHLNRHLGSQFGVSLYYFDRLIKKYYDREALERGGIYGYPRGGCAENCEMKMFPFVSISMAIIDYTPNDNKDLRAVSESAAQLKCYAKSISDSVYVRNRRNLTPAGS